ncbi:Translocator protein [Varanus komodoensis]|nr:Translocator protein [Varanus komodoensis]
MWAHMYGFIVLPHLGGFLGLLFTQKEVPVWFENLKKPSWHPPNIMFPLAWTTLCTSIGYASYLEWMDLDGFNSRAVMPPGLYITQLALNWAWTPLFFSSELIN